MNFNDLKNLFSKERHLTVLQNASQLVRSFSYTEKLIFGILAILITVTSTYLLFKLNDSFLVSIPSHGGTLTEGIVGSPRFINPLLSISDADRDLTALVYSGLLKATASGVLVPDLAESYSVSPDGLEYDFIIKDEAVFQDGKPVTAEDVVFTIQKAQDPNLKSPKRANWDGVRVEKIADREVKITLKQAYAPFLENATLGILPKHLWKDNDSDSFPFSDLNINAVGSGPYKISSLKRGSTGLPASYTLTSFKDYTLGEPYISTIVVKFFGDETAALNAFNKNEIQATGSLTAEQVKNLDVARKRVMKTPLPRVFAVFFNQNQATVLANKEVRQALNMVVDRNELVNQVLHGFGTPLTGPLSPNINASLKQEAANVSSGLTISSNDADSTQENFAFSSTTISDAKKLLTKNGWKPGVDGVMEKKLKKETLRLKFSLDTSNTPELKETAEILKKTWEQIGASVDVKVFEGSELNQLVIRPRKYDALLFGEIVGRNPDLFAFWHSSQRNDPGLNIAMYANIKADKFLQSARTELDLAARTKDYESFEQEVANDVPAVFLFTPDFVYIIPETVQGFSLGVLTTPSERFLSEPSWYLETEKVWPIFVPKETSTADSK